MTKRTITLTNHPPVKINDDEWPCIAVATFKNYDGQYESQANRTWSGYLRVRQHADGRALIYGRYTFDSNFQNERSIDLKAGELTAPGATSADIVDTIRRVHTRINVDSVDWSRLADECIANLPAQEI